LDGNTSTSALQDRYFSLVSSPALPGSPAFRATVDANAVGSGEAGQRSLLTLFPNRVPSQNKSGAFEGSDQWYRAHILFPTGFRPSPNTDWNWVLEWHNWPDTACCANLGVTVDTDPSRGSGARLTLRTMGGGNAANPIDRVDVWHNPAAQVNYFVGDPSLQLNHWYDLQVHVKWSADPSRGLVEWWLDGKLIVSRAQATLFYYANSNTAVSGAGPGPGQAYIQDGYYRDSHLPDGSTDTSTMSVYSEGITRGLTQASVS